MGSLDTVGHEAILSVDFGDELVFGGQEREPNKLERAHDLMELALREILLEEDNKVTAVKRLCFIH